MFLIAAEDKDNFFLTLLYEILMKGKEVSQGNGEVGVFKLFDCSQAHGGTISVSLSLA